MVSGCVSLSLCLSARRSLVRSFPSVKRLLLFLVGTTAVHRFGDGDDRLGFGFFLDLVDGGAVGGRDAAPALGAAGPPAAREDARVEELLVVGEGADRVEAAEGVGARAARAGCHQRAIAAEHPDLAALGRILLLVGRDPAPEGLGGRGQTEPVLQTDALGFVAAPELDVLAIDPVVTEAAGIEHALSVVLVAHLDSAGWFVGPLVRW